MTDEDDVLDDLDALETAACGDEEEREMDPLAVEMLKMMEEEGGEECDSDPDVERMMEMEMLKAMEEEGGPTPEPQPTSKRPPILSQEEIDVLLSATEGNVFEEATRQRVITRYEYWRKLSPWHLVRRPARYDLVCYDVDPERPIGGRVGVACRYE